jgi:subtilase family serine protease
MPRIRLASYTAVLAVAAFLLPHSLAAQSLRRPLVAERINETVLQNLAGNTRPEASRRNDRGAVEDTLPMEHMLLQLQRSPEQEEAVRGLIEELHNPASPKFHQWMTADEFGQAYAPAQEDLNKITTWLKSHGFTINMVYPSGMVIDFSGTAAEVREAFHTPIHYFEVKGRKHIANASNPQIPAAFGPLVTGVVSMHDFLPHSLKTAHRDYTYTAGGTTVQAVVPADLATIYNRQRPNHRRHRRHESLFHGRLADVPLYVRTFDLRVRFSQHGAPRTHLWPQQLRKPWRQWR